MHTSGLHRYRRVLQRAFSVLIVFGLTFCAQAQGEDPESLSIDLAFQHIAVQRDQQGQAVFSGSPVDADTGAPILPCVTLKVLLPPAADISSVAVSLADTKTVDVPGKWDVPAMPPPNGPPDVKWPKELDRSTGRNPVVYSRNALQPAAFLHGIGAGQMREWKIVEVQVTPFRYNPVAQTLNRLLRCELHVTFRRLPSVQPLKTRASRVASYFRKQVSTSVVNFNEMVNEYDAAQNR